MARVALISGISGQDGSYLADLLLTKNYYVWGIIRKSSTSVIQNIKHLSGHPNLTLRFGDLIDGNRLAHILQEIRTKYPDLERLEVYNLGALTHVGVSFELPEYAGNVNGLG